MSSAGVLDLPGWLSYALQLRNLGTSLASALVSGPRLSPAKHVSLYELGSS